MAPSTNVESGQDVTHELLYKYLLVGQLKQFVGVLTQFIQSVLHAKQPVFSLKV